MMMMIHDENDGINIRYKVILMVVMIIMIMIKMMIIIVNDDG